MRLSSPASTVPHTILASLLALSPGFTAEEPFTPNCVHSEVKIQNVTRISVAGTILHFLIDVQDLRVRNVLDPVRPRLRQDACGARIVPPPTVPTSMEGIVVVT